MNKILTIILLSTLISCTDNVKDYNIDQSIVDSSISKISVHIDSLKNQDSIFIKNETYSLEEFRHYKDYQKFICKTTIKKSINTYGRLIKEYYTIKEFYDFELNKIFDLESRYRNIELWSEYYVTRDLSNEIPDYFELNNYKTKEPFVRCTGRLLTVEIPNTKQKAYFGYRINSWPESDSTKIFGIVYYSLNQTENYEIHLKAGNDELFNKIHKLIYFDLEPKSEEDKFQHYNKLYLWSKNGQDEQSKISDFNLVITIRYNLSNKEIRSTKKEFRIPIINGLLFGKRKEDKIFEFEINE